MALPWVRMGSESSDWCPGKERFEDAKGTHEKATEKTEAETGAMLLQPGAPRRSASHTRKLEEAGRVLLQSFRKTQGPAKTSIVEFWPQNWESKFLLF